MTTGKGIPRQALITLIASLVTGVGVFVYVQSKQPHFRKIEKPKSHIRPVTITGEVVDAWCYSSQTMGPGRGEGHKACALACSYGGITMGILEDGTNDLYVAAKYKGYKGCNELLIPYVAQKVTVKGYVGDLGGNRMLRIDTVTPVIQPETKTESKP
ncbi:MAG: hypothetical protein JST01_11485 [Cyanobacteria bacterium SZAS TMP-1]|nr:hypothetical protein [Cyanobacteria bacterium SZAS TMP-1]